MLFQSIWVMKSLPPENLNLDVLPISSYISIVLFCFFNIQDMLSFDIALQLEVVRYTRLLKAEAGPGRA